jgi:hypothetical protein
MFFGRAWASAVLRVSLWVAVVGNSAIALLTVGLVSVEPVTVTHFAPITFSWLAYHLLPVLLGAAALIKLHRGRSRVGPLAEWFDVTFDQDRIHLSVEPPGREPWSVTFPWACIERISFKAEDLDMSDGVYIFTSLRSESYVVPTEASGGEELWGEILRRGLFDPELAIEAASSHGGVFTWPPDTPANSAT